MIIYVENFTMKIMDLLICLCESIINYGFESILQRCSMNILIPSINIKYFIFIRIHTFD